MNRPPLVSSRMKSIAVASIASWTSDERPAPRAVEHPQQRDERDDEAGEGDDAGDELAAGGARDVRRRHLVDAPVDDEQHRVDGEEGQGRGTAGDRPHDCGRCLAVLVVARGPDLFGTSLRSRHGASRRRRTACISRNLTLRRPGFAHPLRRLDCRTACRAPGAAGAVDRRDGRPAAGGRAAAPRRTRARGPRRDQPYERWSTRSTPGRRGTTASGPVPVAWLWSIPAVREQANLLEYLVHHEDVRRAHAGWTARELPAPSPARGVAAAARADPAHHARRAGRGRAALAGARRDAHRPGQARRRRRDRHRCARSNSRSFAFGRQARGAGRLRRTRRRDETDASGRRRAGPAFACRPAARHAQRTCAGAQARLHLADAEVAEVEDARGEHRVGAGRDGRREVLDRAGAAARDDRHVARPRARAGSAQGRSRPSCRRRPSS